MKDLSPKKNYDYIFIIAIFSVSVLLRLVCVWRGYDFERDAIYYIQTVEDWKSTGVFPANRICYFPFLIPYGLSKCGINVSHAFLIQNILIGCLIPVEFYLVMKALHCRSEIVLAVGFFAAYHPTFIHYSCQPLRESLYLFLSLILICFLIHIWQFDSFCYHIIFGVFAAAIFFCRMEGLEWIMFYLFIIFIRQIHSCNSWKRFLQQGLACGLSFAIIFSIAFFPIHNYVVRRSLDIVHTFLNN